MNRKKIIFLSISLLSLTVVSIWYFQVKGPEKLWPTTIKSEQDFQQMQAIALAKQYGALEDYFLFDHFDQTLSYEIENEISVLNNSNQESTQTAHEIINKSLEKILGQQAQVPFALLVFTQDKLLQRFNKNLIEQIDPSLLSDSIIEWKLNFLPSRNLNIDYEKQIENKAHFSWVPAKGWSDNINAGDQHFSLRVRELNVPFNSKFFQYMAGQIHYQLDIKKLQTDQNREKDFGSLTFRKYYRIEKGRPFTETFSSSGFEIDHIRLHSDLEHPIITVDMVQEIINDGEVTDVNRIDLNFKGIQDGIQPHERLNELVFVGTLSSEEGQEILFDATMNNISFDLDEGLISRVDEEKTNLHVNIKTKNISVLDLSLYKEQIKNKIIREHQRDIMTSLKIEFLSDHIFGKEIL